MLTRIVNTNNILERAILDGVEELHVYVRTSEALESDEFLACRETFEDGRNGQPSSRVHVVIFGGYLAWISMLIDETFDVLPAQIWIDRPQEKTL